MTVGTGVKNQQKNPIRCLQRQTNTNSPKMDVLTCAQGGGNPEWKTKGSPQRGKPLPNPFLITNIVAQVREMARPTIVLMRADELQRE